MIQSPYFFPCINCICVAYISGLSIIYKSFSSHSASFVGLVGTHPQASGKSPISDEDWSLLTAKYGVFSHSAITLRTLAFCPLKQYSARRINLLANKLTLRILVIYQIPSLLSSVDCLIYSKFFFSFHSSIG